MRTETINIYQFEELSDDAKETARQWYREASSYDEWWWSVYEDAEQIGIKITSFDDHNITGEFILSAQSVINKIKTDHGPQCETYKTAMEYDGKTITEDEEGYEVVEDDIIDDFLHDILEDYRITLKKEYEWLNDDEQVDDNIICNEYEFTSDGSIY